MAQDYIIKVRAEADTTKLDKQLQYYSRANNNKTKIQVKVEADEKALERLHEKYKLIDDDFKKIKQDVKTAFSHTDESGITKSVDKVTETFKNASGEVQKLITYIEHYKGKHKVLSSVVESSTKTFEGFNNSLDQTAKKSQTIERVVNKYRSLTGVLHTITEETLANGQKIRTFVSEYEKGGQKIRETSKLISDETGKNWKKYDADLKEVINDETKLINTHQRLYEEINKYTNKQGQDVTRIYSEDADGTKHSLITKEYQDSLGRTVQEVSEYIQQQGHKWEQVGQTSKKVINDEISEQKRLAKEQEDYNQKLKDTITLRESHTYRNSKGENVTVDTVTDATGEKIRTITREYETFAGTVRTVVQQVKEIGKAWTKEEEISHEVISNEIADAQKLGNKLEEINRWRAGDGSDFTRTHIIDALDRESVIDVKKYVDDLGNSVEETTTKVKDSNGHWRVLGTTIKKSQDNIAQAEEALKKLNKEIKDKTTTTNSYNKMIGLTTHAIKEEIVETQSFGTEAKKVKTITDEYTDSQGRLVTAITKVDETGKTTTETLIKMGNSAKHLGQSFTDVIVKVTKFYLASLPVRTVQRVITDAVQSVKDFDSALTEFKKVSDLAGESLDNYALKLEELGSVTARTRTEMVQMATEFKRSGFDEDDSAQLAKVASMYQNIADEELSASDASAVLISQIKAFQNQGIEAEHVIDSINEVANKNAVSSGDIGRGLTQAGAALSTYGNTFEETIGLVTAGTEIFQGRSQQVARGLNTVASRIAKNSKALKQYGIDIYDTNDDLKSTYDILSELSGATEGATKTWDEMTKAEQVALGTTLAGVNQYKVFSAVMTNFKTAVKATEDALKSEGSAEKENAKYMESIQAKTQAAKAELQKFVLQGNMLQKVFKAILDVGIKFLKFLNTFQGKVVLLASAVLLLISNLGKIKTFFLSASSFIMPFIKLIGLSIESIGAFTTGVFSASEAVEWFKINLNSLNMNPWMLALSALIMLISAFAIAMYKASKALEEHQKKLRESQSAMEESNNAIAGYKSRLEEINSEFERIKEEIDEINKKDLNTDKNAQRNLNNLKSEIRELKNEQVELENLIKLEQLRTNEERKKQKKEAEKIFESSSQRSGSLFKKDVREQNPYGELNEDYSLLVGGGYLSDKRYNELLFKQGARGGGLNLAQGLEVATAKLKAYSDEFEKLYNKKQASKHGGVFWSDADEKALQQAQDSMNNASAEATYLATTLQEAVDSTDSTAKGYDEAVISLDGFYNSVDKSGKATKETLGIYGDLDEEIDELDEDLSNLKEEYNATDEELERAKTLLDELGLKENAFSKEIGMSSIELIRQADAWNMNEKALYEYMTALNRFDNSLDNIQSNYKILQTAIDEYNEMQGFSVDTTQSLLRMSPEYLEMLDEALSGYKSLEDSITDKIRAQALEAKQVIYNTAVERINELATKDNIESIENQSESFRSSTEDIDEQTRALDENSKETIKNAATRAYRRGATEQEVQQILYDMERQLDAVDEMVLAVGTDFSTAMGNNSKSASSTNSELKEQNNLLKQQKQILEEKKKQYDSVVSYIKKKIQDEIKSIQNEKKEQVDAIKEQIDALKDLKDEELDRIKEQIDALKDQKDVEKDFWQEKIDALKEQNEELNTQLEREKLLEDLAKARSKKVRVYKEGVGFVYTEDTKEVDKAREKIEEFDRKQAYEEQLKILENYKDQSEKNYEEQIKALEKFKDEREKLYDQQIKDLEAYQKQVEADYDARIEYFQNYLDKFTEQTDAYENETNRQLAIQLTGIDFEQQGWQTRLDNLANFVEQYNALLGDINTLSDNELSELSPNTTKRIYTQKNENDDEYDIKDTRDKPSTQVLARIGNYYSGNSTPTARDIKKELEDKQKKEAQEKSNWYAKNYGGKKASGDSYIKEDGMYLVGDSPNQELVIGSKLNGNFMNLTQGSGVVNATSTRTLAGMLNQLGFANQGVNVSNSQSKNTNINIGNISLPSVQNGKDFVDYLQNFSLQMTQEAFA